MNNKDFLEFRNALDFLHLHGTTSIIVDKQKALIIKESIESRYGTIIELDSMYLCGVKIIGL